MVNIAEIKRQMFKERLEKAFGSEEIEKARSGVYADTAENRKKGRVGQKYGEEKKQKDIKLSVDEKSYVRDSINKFRRRNGGAYPDKEYKELLSDLRKKFSGKKRQPLLNYLEKLEHIAGSEGKCLMLMNIQNRLKKAEDNDIEKARHGVYTDTAENRAKQRVGQEYGQAAQPQESGEKRQPKGGEEGGGDIKSYASNASDEALKRAAADKNAKPEVREAAKNELANRSKDSESKTVEKPAAKKEESAAQNKNAENRKEVQRKNAEQLNPEKIMNLRDELNDLFGDGDDDGYKKAGDKYNQLKDEYGEITAYLSIATGPGVPLGFVNYVKALESGATHEIARDYSKEIGQKAFNAAEFKFDMMAKKHQEQVKAVKPFVNKIKAAQGMPDGKVGDQGYLIGISQNSKGEFYMPTKDKKGKWKDGWMSAEEIEKMANETSDSPQ